MTLVNNAIFMFYVDEAIKLHNTIAILDGNGERSKERERSRF